MNLPDKKNSALEHEEIKPWRSIRVRLALIFSVMSAVFNRMADSVRNAGEYLEDKVSARTETLRIMNEALKTEVEERIKTENKLRRTARALKAISECNQAIVWADDEKTLLDDVCRIIVKEGGYRLAWIGYAENNGKKSVRPVAKAGYDEGYVESAEITWADEERGRGPTGTAIRTGRPVIVREVLSDPEYSPWREEAARSGFKSSIALPIGSRGRTFGALSIYSDKTDAFDDEEIELLSELAGDLAFGITALRARSEREKAEKALIENEEKYRAVFNNAAISLVLIDADNGFIVDFNERASRHLGYSRDEFINLKLSDINVPDTREDMEKRIREISEKGEAVYETKHRTKNGEIRDGIVSSRCIDIRGKKFLHNFWRDVTEQRRAEDALRESEARFRRLAENAPDIILRWVPAAGVEYINPAIERVAGFRPEEIVGNIGFLAARIHPDDLPVFLKTIAGSGAAKERLESMELRFFAKDGRTIWLEADFIPVWDDNGRAAAVECMARDITQRKLSERESKANYEAQAIVNNLLRLQLTDVGVEDILRIVIEQLTVSPWLTLEPKGAIFLTPPDGKSLVMKVHHNFSEALKEKCAEVPFGVCLCGRAAETGGIVFADCIDRRHENAYDGMPEHGHYCVPIKSGSKVLGVINLYRESGRERKPSSPRSRTCSPAS